MSDSDELLSALYHALRAPRRRKVIRLLQESDSTVTKTRELARKITALERGLPERRATGEPYRNAYNALSQTHLPTLARAGIVIYDPQRQTVSRGHNYALASLLLRIDKPTVDTFSSLTESDEDPDRNHR